MDSIDWRWFPLASLEKQAPWLKLVTGRRGYLGWDPIHTPSSAPYLHPKGPWLKLFSDRKGYLKGAQSPASVRSTWLKRLAEIGLIHLSFPSSKTISLFVVCCTCVAVQFATMEICVVRLSHPLDRESEASGPQHGNTSG